MRKPVHSTSERVSPHANTSPKDLGGVSSGQSSSFIWIEDVFWSYIRNSTLLLGLLEVVDEQLDALLLIEGGDHPAELSDDLELLACHQDLFAAGA